MSSSTGNMDALFFALRDADLGSISVDRVVSVVAQRFQISATSILSKNRERSVARSRHMVCYLARNLTRMSFPQIGREVGRHHTTVMSSVRRADTIRGRDRAFASEIMLISGLLQAEAKSCHS